MSEYNIVPLIQESIRLKNCLLSDAESIAVIGKMASAIISSYKKGGKLLVCGNGGSAADSQHFVAEMVGRFMLDRRALPAIALTTDTSVLTAISNDYSYDDVFLRQVDALCEPNDVLFGISTSGDSRNVIKAIEKAKEKGATTCSLLGKNGGEMKNISDMYYIVPSSESARIQEVHIMIEHIICQIVEKEFFEK